MTANVDEAEIDKFSEVASRWWDPDSEFKPLHDINPLRIDYIDKRFPLRGLTVLDVGCGGGILSEAMALRGAQVTGIDLSAASLSTARLHALEQQVQVEYALSSAEDFAAIHPRAFDLITCLEMLEHVPDPDAIVSACAAMLKPGGGAVFSTLNRNAKSWLHAIVGAEHVLKLLPRGTHEWNRFIKPSELAESCRQADLQVEDITGLSYNPMTRVYSLSPDIGVNYLMSTLEASCSSSAAD